MKRLTTIQMLIAMVMILFLPYSVVAQNEEKVAVLITDWSSPSQYRRGKQSEVATDRMEVRLKEFEMVTAGKTYWLSPISWI